MDIYGFIFLRGLKTGYRVQNSNKDVDDYVIQTSPNCACASLNMCSLDLYPVVRTRNRS